MLKRLILLWFIVILMGCSGLPDSGMNRTQVSLDATPISPISPSDETTIRFHVDETQISIKRPINWEYYLTEPGIILAEYIGNVAMDGQLGGLLTYVFVHQLDPNLRIVDEPDVNRALVALESIVSNPDYIGIATVSAPQPLEWGGLDAAYYLLNNAGDNLTIAIGIFVPESAELVICSVSAPIEQAERIRSSLPELLDGLSINGFILRGADLDTQIARALTFPEHPPLN